MKPMKSNFFVIYQWMLDELNLKGSELLIYALIFGFTVSPRKKFYGTLNYLASRTGFSKDGVFRAIKKLCSKPSSLLIKEIEYIDGQRYCYYRAALNRINPDHLKEIIFDSQ